MTNSNLRVVTAGESVALDALRIRFEKVIPAIAVKRFGYKPGDALLKTLAERNGRGQGNYAVEWVRGAWEGFQLREQISTQLPDGFDAVGLSDLAAELEGFDPAFGVDTVSRAAGFIRAVLAGSGEVVADE